MFRITITQTYHTSTNTTTFFFRFLYHLVYLNLNIHFLTEIYIRFMWNVIFCLELEQMNPVWCCWWSAGATVIHQMPHFVSFFFSFLSTIYGHWCPYPGWTCWKKKIKIKIKWTVRVEKIYGKEFHCRNHRKVIRVPHSSCGGKAETESGGHSSTIVSTQRVGV